MTGRAASALGLEPAVYTTAYQAEAGVAVAAAEQNVRTVLEVAAEFSGLVADMNRTEMTPAQLARLDVIFAGFERILADVRAIRADLQVAALKV